MNQPTKGAIEAEIANAVVRFHREQQGRGPSEVRAHLLGDMLVVRCTGIFTPTEARLAGTDEGRRLIRSSRSELRAINHQEIEGLVGRIAGCEVLRSYCDTDVVAEEQVEVYILTVDMEKRLLRQDLDSLGRLGRRRGE